MAERKSTTPSTSDRAAWQSEASMLDSRAVYSGLVSALRIDKHDLDTDAARQPTLFHDAGEGLANALSMRDQAEAAVSNEEAELDSEIRRKAQAAEEKLSEPQIKAKVGSSPKVQDKRARYLAWKDLATRWANLQRSYDQRKDMIRVEANLYSAGYFSSASTSASHREASGVRAGDIKDKLAGARQRGRSGT